MNNGINILFYSKDCVTCRNLLNLLKNENLLCYFKLICVDNNLKAIPAQITMVPTMILSNINKPLVVQETFEWVKKMKFIRNQQISDINKKIIQQNLIKIMNDKNCPKGFVELEMSGVSDSFAFTDVDTPLDHTFFNLGEEEKNAIFTTPELSKLSKDEQLSKINNLKSERNDHEQFFYKLMKKQQIQTVLNDEQEKLTQQNSTNFSKQKY
ncbi:Hypothetical protein KVN_LOCUS438 [uncultured virus]|nr:Hypothetical protein KVN_LOCUS438 [uncultured virus]